MQRYFLKNNEIVDETVQLSGDDYHHIVRVMRMAKEDEISVVLPSGKVAICSITNITDQNVHAKIVSWDDTIRELPIHVTIASGLLKGDKYDMVIQKGTELGASTFIPFSSERSVVKLDEKKGMKKIERWSKIAKEASEQSERNIVPKIVEPCSLKDVIAKSEGYTLKICAYEESGREKESNLLYQNMKQLSHGDSILMLFGPEGGFSTSEIQLIEKHGFKLCGLGPRILRAETAPLYSLSAISFYFELQR